MEIKNFLKTRLFLPLGLTILVIGFVAGISSCSQEVSANQKTASKTVRPSYQNGDVVFQTSESSMSQGIQLATNSAYSHVGILFFENSKWMVYEAVQPVCKTELYEWQNRGKDGYCEFRRLSMDTTKLTTEQIAKMKTFADKQIGKNYDSAFDWDDEKMYCSELVWKCYKEGAGIELCAPRPLKDYDLTHPLVRQKLEEKYGKNIPLDELMVSPGDLFTSKILAQPMW
jgi:hypothetical protein